MKRRAPSRERRELGVGTTSQEAIASFAKFDAAVHECIRDEATGLFQVFRRRKQVDRTIRTSITRETRFTVRDAGKQRPLLVSLLPRDLIAFRPKGTRQLVVVELEKLYRVAAQWDAFKKAAKVKLERAAARKARRAA